MYTNSLSHHGILGMKWGIRRYQNPDGSLTEAGKKRYSKTELYDIKDFDRDLWAAQERKKSQDKRHSRSDAENEAELKSAYEAWDSENFDSLPKSQQNTMISLQNEIFRTVTGELGHPAFSEKAKNFDNKYDKWIDENYDRKRGKDWQNYFKDREALRLEYCGIALEELGFKDTEKNRKYIYGLVWDDVNLPIDDKINHSMIQAGIDFLESPLDSLSHHGILGMKWGIRRYQNPDGTWTEAGKKRYGRDLAKKVSKASDWKKASELVKNSKVVAEFNSNSESYEKLQRINKDISSLQKDINRSVNDALEKKYGFFNDLIMQEDDKKMLAYLAEGAEKFNTLWEKSGGKDLLMSQLDISKEYEKECQTFIRAVSGEIGNLPTKIPSALTYDIASDKARKSTANEVITLEMLRAAGCRI